MLVVVVLQLQEMVMIEIEYDDDMMIPSYLILLFETDAVDVIVVALVIFLGHWSL